MWRYWTTRAVVSTALVLLAAPLCAGKDDGEDRDRVKHFAFTFAPAAKRPEGLPALKVALLPVRNDADLKRQTQETEALCRNLAPDEIPRLIGERSNAYGKPLNRFIVDEPLATIVSRELGRELEALGFTLVPSGTTVPADLETESLLAALDSGATADMILGVSIDSFWFHTEPGMTKVKMETFLRLEVKAVDARSRAKLWSGTVDAGAFSAKGMSMGRDAVETRLDEGFRALIEGVVRNNAELRAKLGPMVAAESR